MLQWTIQSNNHIILFLDFPLYCIIIYWIINEFTLNMVKILRWFLYVCLFGVYRPSLEFFTHMEMWFYDESLLYIYKIIKWPILALVIVAPDFKHSRITLTSVYIGDLIFFVIDILRLTCYEYLCEWLVRFHEILVILRPKLNTYVLIFKTTAFYTFFFGCVK